MKFHNFSDECLQLSHPTLSGYSKFRALRLKMGKLDLGLLLISIRKGVNLFDARDELSEGFFSNSLPWGSQWLDRA